MLTKADGDERVLISEVYGPVVQGEGPVIGRPTIFVRTFGCDSLCRLCDTLYAVDPNHPDATRTLMLPAEIAERVDGLDPTGDIPVTFSGGNPVIWNLGPVVEALLPRWLWVETQGTYWRDWLQRVHKVVVSPKGPFMDDRKLGVCPVQKLQVFYDRVEHHRLYFKVVVAGPADFDYAEVIAREYPSIPMYLSLGNSTPYQDNVQALLHHYQALEQLLLHGGWSTLRRRAVLLPQLHVLVHGANRGI